jgi:hypothetical protein
MVNRPYAQSKHLAGINKDQSMENSISMERYQFSESNKSGSTQKGFVVIFLRFF